jgi:beta-hydroxylase
MFLNPADYPFTQTLADGWRTIRAELDRLNLTQFTAWPERFLYESGWNVFGLYAFGRKLEKNCALCPETTRLVEGAPGLTTAGFSWLEPGTHIKPHVGYTKAVLRCHLGLIVPDRDACQLRVGAETQSWEEGRCLLFDDTTEHEAWNRGAAPRVVLLLDFLRAGAVFTPPPIQAILPRG